jgi:hypothetical protein
MKKPAAKTPRKIALRSETVAVLDDQQLRQVAGGDTRMSWRASCGIPTAIPAAL